MARDNWDDLQRYVGLLRDAKGSRLPDEYLTLFEPYDRSTARGLWPSSLRLDSGGRAPARCAYRLIVRI